MKKTLLVLGAGASKDLYQHFPTGLELIRDINYHLTLDKISPIREGQGPFLSSMVNELLRILSNGRLMYNKEAIPLSFIREKRTEKFLWETQIFKTELWDYVLGYEWKAWRCSDLPVAISIDRFINEKYSDNFELKKIAQYTIAFLLKGVESAFYYVENICPRPTDINWVKLLVDKLNVHDTEDVLRNFKIATFNYDRSFEYLFTKYSELSSAQIDDFLQHNVVHVYGSLGSLSEMGFGVNNDSTEVMKKFYDGIDLMFSTRTPILNYNDIDQVAYLGFSYDRDNLCKLQLSKNAMRIGTSVNFNDEYRSRISDEYGIQLSKCYQYCKQVINNLEL